MSSAPVRKRFWSSNFAPPALSALAGVVPSEVTPEEILAGGVRESDWSFPVLISCPSVDRVGDVVVPEGCDYRAFARSPILFFDHQEVKFPVGSLRGPDGRLYLAIVPGKGILGRVWIRKPNPDEASLPYTEACHTVWLLVRDGLLNGVSAGFDPIGPVKALPSGGDFYQQWELLEVSLCPIAANRDCLVIREPFSFDERVLKRFSPSVIKGLKAMPATKKPDHHGTHDIKFRAGKWVILDDKSRKVLSEHQTRADALSALRALQFGKHEKSLSETAGADGGYLESPEYARMCRSLGERMSDHADAVKGHFLHFNPQTGELHHSYPDDTSAECVKALAADLHDVPGVKSLTQQPESGPEEGGEFQQIYPPDTSRAMGHRMQVAKGARYLGRVGKALYRMVRTRRIKHWVGKSLEWAARRAMTELARAEMPEGRAIAVAYGIAGVRKGLLPLVAKAVADDTEDDKDAASDPAEDAADDAAADVALNADEDAAGETQPRSLELCQVAIEELESALPGLEPEDRDFVQGIIDQFRDWGEQKHPDEDFGGNDEEDEKSAAARDGNDADEQQITNEMLARYKGTIPRRVKRISIVKKLKALRRDPVAAEAIRRAANHLHEIGDMEGSYDDQGCHLKGYTAAHQRQCRIRARELDRLHGAVTKGDVSEPQPQPQGPPAAEDDAYLGALMPHLKSLKGRVERMSDHAGALLQQVTGRRDRQPR